MMYGKTNLQSDDIVYLLGTLNAISPGRMPNRILDREFPPLQYRGNRVTVISIVQLNKTELFVYLVLLYVHLCCSDLCFSCVFVECKEIEYREITFIFTTD